MRLPMQGEEVDLAQTQQMVDAFLAPASTILTPPTVIWTEERNGAEGLPDEPLSA